MEAGRVTPFRLGLRTAAMDNDTLFEVYIDQLKDIWSANDQMRDMVARMAETAGDPQLARLLGRIVTRLEEQSRTLQEVLGRYGEEEEPDRSRAMHGLTLQAQEDVLDKPLTEAARDVMIVAVVQRMAHYGIAGYGTARALAEAQHLKADAEILSTDLDEVYATDELLTHLAEHVINPASADEQEDDEDEDDERDYSNGIGEHRNGIGDDLEDDEDDEDDDDEDEDNGGRR